MNHSERGATAVEFALVLMMFLTFLLAVTDFSRMMYTWNAANEATRLGARYAVVCDDTNGKDNVLRKMQAMVPAIGDIDLGWNPAGCNFNSCEGVTVRITSLEFKWIAPMMGSVAPRIPLPTFSTYLPREIMRQDINSVSICQ